MARILSSPPLSARLPEVSLDPGRLLLLAIQVAVVGGISALIILAVVNAILGTTQPEPVYSPYE